MSGVTIIAEAGVNHNGCLDLALQLVDAAAEAGADIVKFQTFRAEQLVTRKAAKAEYQNRGSEAQNQFDMLKALELDADAPARLLAHCRDRNIEFLSTPFDLDSLKLLVGLGLKRIKIGSGDLTNTPFLLALAGLRRDVILSTGMATLEDIADALGALASGYCGQEKPNRDNFRAALKSPAGEKALRDKVILLHCTSDYPAADHEINLKAMDTLSQTFGLPVGFSDHSVGIAVPIAAAARGAIVIEKHLTLDRSMRGPDHAASIEPGDFAAMVSGIRQVEHALGNGAKTPTPSENKMMLVARKSIVAQIDIRRGEVFSLDNLTVKRPGSGLAPILLWDLWGRPASRDYAADDLIVE